MTEDPQGEKSTAERLAAWRATERDTVAAHAAAEVADLALTAATAAEEAAAEVEAAAMKAAEAVELAKVSVAKARMAATRAAEAATLALASAQGDKVRADLAVEHAEWAEETARHAYHEAVEGRQPDQS